MRGGDERLSDCISVHGLVALVVLVRTKVQTAAGDLAGSAVSSVSGDRPEHLVTSGQLVRFSPGGSGPLSAAALRRGIGLLLGCLLMQWVVCPYPSNATGNK